MHLTTFTDYTLRVLIYLAIEPGKLATIPEMANAYGISENHLMKVVHRLARSGVIESVRGKGGGVRLVRDPIDIRLGEVIRASEGDAAIVECFSPEANHCRIAPACKLTRILGNAFDGLYRSLDAYTLADITANGQELGCLLATE
jgi:Rrf2 family transcriptional regulator, nitric oxide-sensitive transcriptional repressor